jgi:hypothetical protein
VDLFAGARVPRRESAPPSSRFAMTPLSDFGAYSMVTSDERCLRGLLPGVRSSDDLFNSGQRCKHERILRWVRGGREPASSGGPTEGSNGSDHHQVAVGGPVDPTRSPLVVDPAMAMR